METITISKKDAELLRKGASKSQKKILDKIIGGKTISSTVKSKDIYDAKSFEELCAIKGVKSQSILPFKKAKNTFQQGINFFAKLSFIRDVLSKGWEANWNDSNEKKWYPWFIMGSGFAFSFTSCEYDLSGAVSGSRLCLQDEKSAEHFGKVYLQEWKDFLNK